MRSLEMRRRFDRHGIQRVLTVLSFAVAVACLVTVGQGDASEEETDAVPGGQPPMGPPPALVALGEVKEQELQARWDVVGRLREVKRAVVAAEQSGRVTELQVEEGDIVTGGKTVIARIDGIWVELSLDSARAGVAQTEAGIAEAEARHDQAKRELAYLEELLKANSAKPKEVDDARATERAEAARLDGARADLLSARAEVRRWEERSKRLDVLAPFDGWVVRKLTEVGQWVDPGETVAEIVSRGSIDAVLDVPERFVNSVHVGQSIEILIESIGAEAVGEVVAVNPMGSTAARSFPVKVRLDDSGGLFKPGMSALGRVPLSRQESVLTVPRDAVSQTGTGSVVWAEAMGLAVPVPVAVAFGEGDRYAVRVIGESSGVLRDGAMVVTEGAERLFPGRPLLPDTAAPPKPDSEE